METELPAGRASAQARLRDIQSLIDAELSLLSDHDFLTELLVRLRDILGADTAAVLLLDSPAGHLVATAAAGLEEEVRQGVRIPVGQGFAGRIAAERTPVVLDRVDRTTVFNPILLDKGIRSLAGVPLIAHGRVLGVMHVGSLTGQRFTRDDVELLQLAGSRAAITLQSMMARDERIAAMALQRSFVPTALPHLAGAEMAARYVPGHGVVGGDWYDVFTLPSGEVGLVIGDIAGSGLAAAVLMGRMRSALRAYALQCPDPGEVLARLDRKVQHFEPGAMGTVLYAILPPALDQVRMASAGHLPPVLAVPGQAATLVPIRHELMIGVIPTGPRTVTSLDLPPGASLCLYTDGIVERPGQVIDESLERLRQLVTAQPPEAGCAAVMSALVGDRPARDDIALLMFRRRPVPG
ncbi:MAG TPA: GAF domain-containing SpoIIE family protein phosphatase [Streptosporangiaceae bacterium]|jgi:serine phosphatase RsbU (regulator of sigma subunit)